ncbi:MAG: glycosyltransferase, partial [Vicinamibacterales bacterium]|nr:glycosyltransferase [Vicinamibacterales bacterium]
MTTNKTAEDIREVPAVSTSDFGPATIAYLCLQATRQGQASYAHVHEIIHGLEQRGCSISLFEPEYAPGNMPGAFGRATEFMRVQRRLCRASRSVDALYVRAHFAALPAALWARRHGIPFVLEVNGPYEDLFVSWPWTRRLAKFFIALSRWQFRNADALITVTPQLAEWLSSEAAGNEVCVIPNGANTHLFTPSAVTRLALPECYVVFFGALAAWQGLDTLTQAVLDRNWPEQVSLVVAGDGPERSTIEEAATSPRVVYMGSIPYEEV